jgi:hydroxymethylbilane synthase|tara:strand:+ start:1029 stop:1934 length:906 start_codon:yes stop_codon:yes gene_type:complete
MKKITIGSRGSKLALIYAERVKKEIQKFYKDHIEIKTIVTSGDKNQKDRLSDLGGKGLFSKNIEIELLENKIDLAVHALKDMPSLETKGLLTDCFLKRNDPNEILISKNNIKFNKLKSSSVVGTSSFRREFQLKNKRADLNFKLIRGNVDTRIKKLNEGKYDAIILSKAGIKSLNLMDHITEEFSTDDIIPSVGQGAIAIQCRSSDNDMIKFLKKINHMETHICVTAEREVLKILEGDCETAVGAISKIEGNNIYISAELFSIDGKERYYFKSSKNINLSKDLGKEVGKILKEQSKGSYKK